jgi:hypothetical protein
VHGIAPSQDLLHGSFCEDGRPCFGHGKLTSEIVIVGRAVSQIGDGSSRGTV